jgi:hypothetical protein
MVVSNIFFCCLLYSLTPHSECTILQGHSPSSLLIGKDLRTQLSAGKPLTTQIATPHRISYASFNLSYTLPQWGQFAAAGSPGGGEWQRGICSAQSRTTVGPGNSPPHAVLNCQLNREEFVVFSWLCQLNREEFVALNNGEQQGQETLCCTQC